MENLWKLVVSTPKNNYIKKQQLILRLHHNSLQKKLTSFSNDTSPKDCKNKFEIGKSQKRHLFKPIF